jgi:uncharacterized protein YcfJ
MRMFLVAVVVMAISGVGAAAVLNVFQKPADIAFTTKAVSIRASRSFPLQIRRNPVMTAL